MIGAAIPQLYPIWYDITNSLLLFSLDSATVKLLLSMVLLVLSKVREDQEPSGIYFLARAAKR